MIVRTTAVLAALAVGATVVYAQSAAIAARKETMKAQAAATKAPGTMIKGEAPFELDKVQASLRVFQEQATKLKDLWPDDSKSGGDTRALPAVWEKKADFLARLDKFASDAKAAESAIKDEATFKAEWGKLLASNCVACHKEYQKPNQ